MASLTFKKRYTVGCLDKDVVVCGKTKSYNIVYEHDVLATAKKEADKLFAKNKVETVVWDSDRWSHPNGEVVYTLGDKDDSEGDDS